MKMSFLKLSPVCSALLLAGCSTNFLPFDMTWEEETTNEVAMCSDSNGVKCMKKKTELELFMPPEEPDSVHRSYTLHPSHQHFSFLGEYVEQMALDISHDLNGFLILHPIAVASFVHLDSSLKSTDALGNQIAEHFITELREMGFAVNDHKISGNIQVTPRGDFAFSRDVDELKNRQNAGYVLTGTMIQQTNGTLINARIVGLTSNTVVASSSKLVPNLIQ